MNRQLELIDRLVAEGRESFTFADAQAALGVSATAAANVLRRLRDQGLVDVVTRGHYSIRPLGALGTSTVTDSLPLAIGAAFAGRRHRIAYSSAFSELGLLTHPVRRVYVASEDPVGFKQVSGRPL